MPSATGGISAEVLNYNRGLQPVIAVGGGTAQGAVAGSVSRQISVAGFQPGATGADNVLAIYSIPANTFDGVGNRGFRIWAAGKYGATANNKTVKIIINPTTAVVGATISGGTTLMDTGVVASNNLPFFLNVEVFKTGVLGTNTQYAQAAPSFSGAAIVVPAIPVFLAAIETGAIIIAITGNAATAVSDILLHRLEVEGLS